MILKENKKFGSKGNTYFNIFRKYCEKKEVFNGYSCKNVTKMLLAYSFVSEHPKYFFFIF